MAQINETDAQKLNRTYFTALRAAAARSIPEACAKFSIPPQVAERVSCMTMDEIDRLSLSNMVMFKPVIEPNQFMKIVGVEDAKMRAILSRLGH